MAIKNSEAGFCSEKYIVNKIGRYKNDKFIPVMIYQKTNFKGVVKFSGMGSLFLLNNTLSIITAEHIFNKENRNSFFFCKNVFTGEEYDIRKITMTGYELTNEPSDIMLLEIGKMKKIDYIFKEESENLSESNSDKSGKILTSLLSGQKVKIIGGAIAKEGRFKVKYLIIDYLAKTGESGTGFVDDENNIYIFKALVGINNNYNMGIVYGPLSF